MHILTGAQIRTLRDIALDDVANMNIDENPQDRLKACQEQWAAEIVARDLNPDGVLDTELVGDLEAEVGAAIYGAYSWEYARILARENVRQVK